MFSITMGNYFSKLLAWWFVITFMLITASGVFFLGSFLYYLFF